MGSLVNSWATTVVDDTVSQKVPTINGALQILDSSIDGRFPIVITGGTRTLSGTNALPEAQNLFLDVSGLLASDGIIEIPVSITTSGRNRVYVVRNGTTGNKLLTVRAVGGTGVIVPRNVTVWLLFNGTDIQYFSGPITCERDVTTNNSALSLFNVALPTLAYAGGLVSYAVLAKNATDVQVRRGLAAWSMVNKAAAFTTEVVVVSEAASLSTGTLTCSPTLVSGSNLVTFKLTPNSSITPTTYLIRLTITNDSEQAIALL